MFGLINENLITEGQDKWSEIISEEYNVKDNPSKLSWMSRYARIHEIKEGLQQGDPAGGIYATPLNTMGMGNPMMPQGVGFNGTDGSGIGNTGADFHNPNYKVGSGDIPMSTLPMSLEVAYMTIGLELVPVIPATGPWAMLSYMDFPYAGGKLGRINETNMDGKGENDSNKPIYIKFNAPVLAKEEKAKLEMGVSKIEVDNEDSKKLNGIFIGFSMIDGGMIVKVVDCGDADTSIADVFSKKITAIKVTEGTAQPTYNLGGGMVLRPELVSTAADHVQGFSNFFDGGNEPMTRAQNETGVGNTIGARMFTKMIQMGSYEVTGTVTRQQLQDLPLYGVDVIGKVLEAMQNELSQAINNRILDRVFKLGVTNAKLQKDIQGVDFNLFFGPTATADKDLANFAAAKHYVDINGVNVAKTWGKVKNATQNTAAENLFTHQRRIMSRVLAAANLITNVSRWGRPNWVVTNTQIVTALQDVAGYVINPAPSTISSEGSLYFSGSIAGLSVYVDPYMLWEDTRICVGRKSNGNNPGVVFMPYILCDTIQTVVEGTMAPKLLCNSRFAIVDAGFHPEQNYYTFMVDADGAYLI